MKRELEGDMVFDAGVLIDLMTSTPGGIKVKNKLLEGLLTGFSTELAITELRYVLCRKLGFKKAKKLVDMLISSGYIVVEDISPLIDLAAVYKCERAISLPDCFSIALGEYLSLPVLFARREAELQTEIKKKPFNIEIHFLEDFI